MEKKVIGLGGIFFKSKDNAAFKEWYKKHLGIESESWGYSFEWRRKDNPDDLTYTAWSPFKAETTYFEPSKQDFMLNYQVENLDELLAELRAEGVHVFEKTEDSEYGKFGWILDLEGNKVELWEPPVSVGSEQ